VGGSGDPQQDRGVEDVGADDPARGETEGDDEPDGDERPAARRGHAQDEADSEAEHGRGDLVASRQLDGVALALDDPREEQGTREDEDAGDDQRDGDRDEDPRVDGVAVGGVQPVEHDHAPERARDRSDAEPNGDAHVDRALAQVAPAADRLGHRRVGQVGPDGHHRLDPEEQDQQRRHERAAAHAGGPDEHADAEAEEDQQRVHLDVEPALGLGRLGPAALAAGSRLRARLTADRRVAAVVERVVGKVVVVHVAPHVALRPSGEGVVLGDAAPLVVVDQGSVAAGARLLAADAGDPSVDAGQGALERGHLGVAAAVLGAPGPMGFVHLDPHGPALLEGPPRGKRFVEEHAGVDREDAGVGSDRGEQVDEDRLLLLKGAGQHQARVVALDGEGQRVPGLAL